jgi:flagella basal body P-ring formation protein FlgA
MRVSRAGVYASQASEVVGRALKKNIAQGETIPLNSIADVPIINNGKTVIIVARNAGLRVEARGEALEAGTLGDSIRVRNTTSKTVLRVVVVAEDTVEVKVP